MPLMSAQYTRSNHLGRFCLRGVGYWNSDEGNPIHAELRINLHLVGTRHCVTGADQGTLS